MWIIIPPKNVLLFKDFKSEEKQKDVDNWIYSNIQRAARGIVSVSKYHKKVKRFSATPLIRVYLS